jgi:hypothetical protein
MSTTNYPFFQDTAFQSFRLYDEAKQILIFGRTFGQSELLPVDLGKVFADPTVPIVFLQEFSYTEQHPSATFNDEVGNLLQSTQMRSLLQQMQDYYLSLFAYKIAMGLVTDIRSTIQHKGGASDIQLTFTAKVVWFGPSFCDYV